MPGPGKPFPFLPFCIFTHIGLDGALTFCDTSSWYNASREIRFFQAGKGGVTFSNVTVYEGLYNAWPDRSDYATTK